MTIKAEDLNFVVVTDCGSTTTKALLFEKTSSGWRQTCRGEAPTTVEEPVADVTIGAENSFREIQEVSGREILLADGSRNGDSPFLTRSGDCGIDLYLSTSSAGGGLQMLVTGVVRQMSAESAERAALGAGAIVMEVISADDGREDHERVERIRHIRPDIVLITGGVDGGSTQHVIEMAETLLSADPKPRFGSTLRLPVIFAGNSDAADEVSEILEKLGQIEVVENVRPTLEQENLRPARDAIHEFFLKHVMSHSPGYGKLLSWTPVPIMPTPAAVGDMMRNYAESTDQQVLCVDIGGATTDLFSVFRDAEGVLTFNRTVSANLGMSYSIANVLIEAGTEAISRWLPYDIDSASVRDRLRNKMIRPTSIPQTIEDLWLEQAVCREALRLALEHHRSLAVGLSGVQQRRGIADVFNQTESRYQLVDMMELDLVIGSGGVLSHAPKRLGAALMMLDGFGLEGVTQIAVDSIFMLPHLGVFSSVHLEAAQEIFSENCLISICHSIVPVWERLGEAVTKLAEVHLNGESVGTVERGEVRHIPIKAKGKMNLSVVPGERQINVGAGRGETLNIEIEVGLEGLILDGRNRPMISDQNSVFAQQKIFKELGLEAIS